LERLATQAGPIVKTVFYQVDGASLTDIERATMARIQWRILPLLFCIFILNYLDRVNIGFAALRMNADIGLTPEIFGLGAGVLFAGYILLEIPAGLLMQRTGARRFLAGAVGAWGLLSVAMSAVSGSKSFLVLRFLIGLAEGGFLPCAIVYISNWFPQYQRARAFSLFLVATTLSFIIGGPISGLILSIPNLLGIASWRWMFICEGVPTVVMGIVSFLFLTDQPEQASWLTSEQRTWLQTVLERELASKSVHGISNLSELFADVRVWLLGLSFFLVNVGVTTLLFWLPQILKSASGRSDLSIGFLSGIPFVGAAFGLIFNARHSDRTGERVGHIIVACLVGAAGLLLCALSSGFWLGFGGLCVGAIGLWGAVGVFWTLPTSYLSGSAIAAGVPLINCLASLSGLIAPYAIGWMYTRVHSFSIALTVVAGCVSLSGFVLKLLRAPQPQPASSPLTGQAVC
jgi:MFS transporter, ACS family, tartrate transporter